MSVQQDYAFGQRQFVYVLLTYIMSKKISLSMFSALLLEFKHLPCAYGLIYVQRVKQFISVKARLINRSSTIQCSAVHVTLVPAMQYHYTYSCAVLITHRECVLWNYCDNNWQARRQHLHHIACKYTNSIHVVTAMYNTYAATVSCTCVSAT